MRTGYSPGCAPRGACNMAVVDPCPAVPVWRPRSRRRLLLQPPADGFGGGGDVFCL